MAVVLSTRDEIHTALGSLAERPGLVPTMGALHRGHESLIARSARENAQTVVSIFVNPTQFGNTQDLAAYPRVLDADIEIAAAAGATHIFAPSATEIYDEHFDTWVAVPRLSALWEGATRAGHFRGVCTIVSILLNLVQPHRAYFGEKDFQQLQIIRRMHRDMALPGCIVGCPIVRDPDGLALSSRNQQLSTPGRLRAREIPRTLDVMRNAASAGERNSARLIGLGHAVLAAADIKTDYLAIVDPDTLDPVVTPGERARIVLAAEIDGVHLIDNAPIGH